MISFKNVKGLALVSALGASLVLSTGVVHADGGSQTTTGTFNVTAGNGNSSDKNQVGTTGLYLESAPSFNFGSINLSTIVTGGNVTKNQSTNNNLSVQDYQGSTTNSGWTVTASADAFTAAKDSSATAADTINANITWNSSEAGNYTTGATISKNNSISAGGVSASSTILAYSPDKAYGDADDVTSTVSDATISFAKNTAANLNTNYTSTITWTLSNTATASATNN